VNLGNPYEKSQWVLSAFGNINIYQRVADPSNYALECIEYLVEQLQEVRLCPREEE
jgi:hypothetical protein